MFPKTAVHTPITMVGHKLKPLKTDPRIFRGFVDFYKKTGIINLKRIY